MSPEKTAQQAALEQAHGIGPLSEEDQAAYDTLQHEYEDARNQHFDELGHKAVSQLVEVNGVVETAGQVASTRQAGQEVPTSAYEHGRR